MSSFPESSGTTALTNALKKVFYIHKDVVAELKAKLDTVLHENARLKQELNKVSPRRAEKCESCTHFKELNKTLQENFNSRLKDKNAIIKHLERRLRASGASQYEASCTEDISITAGDKTTENANVKALTSSPLNTEESPDSQTFSCHKDGEGGVEDDSCSSRQNKRLRLLRDGRKRSRYIEEAPDSKKQKTSPSNSSESRSVSLIRKSRSSKEKSVVASLAGSQTESSPAETEFIVSNHTILAAETEYTLPAETPETVSDVSKHDVNARRARNHANNCNAPNKNNLVIPETMGLYSDVEGASDIDAEDDAESPVFHRDQSPQRTERPFVKVENGLWPCGREEEQKYARNSPVQFASPSLSKSRTETTTTPLSPGIFDDVLKKKSHNETPRSAPPVIDGEFETKPTMFDGEGLSRETRDDDVYMSYSAARGNQRVLRQTTLSQSFNKNCSPHAKEISTDAVKVSGDFDDGDLQKAIKASLEESSVSKSRKKNEPKTDHEINCRRGENSSFIRPLSPEQLKTLKSPKQKSLKEKENDFTSSSKKSPGTLIQKHGTRTSPRLSKLVKTQSEPLSSQQKENARKTLFNDASSLHKNSSHKQNMKKSLDHRPSKEKQTDVAMGKTNDNRRSRRGGNKFQESLYKDLPHEELSLQDCPKMGRRSTASYNNESCDRNVDGRIDSQDGYGPCQKGNEKNQLGGLNGSLNPDIQLSMYLESQMTCVGYNNKKRLPNIDLDETVAPSLMPGNRPLSQSLRMASVQEDANNDGSDSDDNSDVEETIAPSPQQSSILSFHSQSESLPSASISCSSRSFKFASKPRGNITSDTVGRNSKHNRQKSLNDERGYDNGKMRVKVEVIAEGNHDSVKTCDRGNVMTSESQGRESSRGGNPPSHKDPVNDSFDALPQKPAEFPHLIVIRKKSERDKLQGFSCKLCYEYYKDLNLSEAELKYRMQVCSRHKEKYQAPATPQHFWSMSIPDTAEAGEEHGEQVEVDAGIGLLNKGSRRRRKLEKRFKSRSEDDKDLDI